MLFCVFVFLYFGNLNSFLFLVLYVLVSFTCFRFSFKYFGVKSLFILCIIVNVLNVSLCLTDCHCSVSSINFLLLYLFILSIILIALFCIFCSLFICSSFIKYSI